MTKEGLSRHSRGQSSSNEEVCFVAQFLNKLMGRSSVEDVVFDRGILIIQLIQQAKRRNIRNTVTESCLTELGRNSLSYISRGA